MISFNNVSIYLGFFSFSLLLCYTIHKWFRGRNYPPGPIGLPLVGYLFSMGKKSNLTTRDLGLKYGDIFSFYMGPKLMICSTEYTVIKELLNHPNVLARPPMGSDFIKGNGGMFGLNGEAWQRNRRFVIMTMRNLGIGKGLWERMIQEIAADFVNTLAEARGQPIMFTEISTKSHIIGSLSVLFGRHLDKDKEKEEIEVVCSFGKKANGSVAGVVVQMLSSIQPGIIGFLRYFNILGVRDFYTILKKFEAIFVNEVDQRMKMNNDNQRDDFIGCYLAEMEKIGSGAEKEGFSVDNLIGNLIILLLAGHDSSVASVNWLLLLMAKHPDVQEKVCNEISNAIGRDGTVFYEDKNKLPYTMATIFEMSRWVSIAAIFPPRCVTETFTFHGYEIPEGAFIMCNGWAMMHDAKYFPDPMAFKPERFLTEEGKVKYSNVDGYGPFSFGKRNCPGDGLAIMNIYLYFVTIMQKFTVKPLEGKEPNLDYKLTSGVLPIAQELRFIERE